MALEEQRNLAVRYMYMLEMTPEADLPTMTQLVESTMLEAVGDTLIDCQNNNRRRGRRDLAAGTSSSIVGASSLPGDLAIGEQVLLSSSSSSTDSTSTI